jgi:hypothetical protein
MKPHLIYDQHTNEVVVENIPSHHEAEEVLAGMLLDPDYARHKLVIMAHDDAAVKHLIPKELTGDTLQDDYMHFGHH